MILSKNINNIGVMKIRKRKYRQRQVYKKCGGKCVYCGKSLKIKTNRLEEKMTIDHWIPKSRGGDGNIENLVCACNRCNSKKGDQMPEEFLKQLEN